MMEEQEVKDLIEKTLEDYTQKNAYGVSLIPAHGHTGVDSAQIDPADLLGFPTSSVTDATVAPTDNPSNGTIRFYYDGVNYVQWVTVNGIWKSINMSASSSLDYTDIISATHNPTGTAAWEDWDISALVAAGATVAEVFMRNVDAGTKNLGARSNGSAINRFFPLPTTSGVLTLQCPIDSNGIIEIYAATTVNTNAEFKIIGYWS